MWVNLEILRYIFCYCFLISVFKISEAWCVTQNIVSGGKDCVWSLSFIISFKFYSLTDFAWNIFISYFYFISEASFSRLFNSRLIWIKIFFHYLAGMIQLSSDCIVLDQKSAVIFRTVPYIQYSFFSRCFCSFWVLYFYYGGPRCRFPWYYSTWVLLRFLDLWIYIHFSNLKKKIQP